MRDGLLQCAACGRQTSVTAGTLLHRSKLPLRLGFRATWSVTSHKHGASALGVRRALGPGSYRTAWTWLHQLHRAMVRPGRDRLHRRGEVDETYAGERKRARGAGKPPPRRWRRSRSKHRSTAPGSGASACGWLRTLRARVCRGSCARQSSRARRCMRMAGRATPNRRDWGIRTRWQSCGTPSWKGSCCRLSIGSRRCSSAGGPELTEFSFRFNRRKSRSRGQLCYRLLQHATAIEPAPDQSIVGGKSRNADP